MCVTACPDRYDYDTDEYVYDEETDTLFARDEGGTDYRGDGEPLGDDDQQLKRYVKITSLFKLVIFTILIFFLYNYS